MCACESKRGAQRERVGKGGTCVCVRACVRACVCVCTRFSVVIIIISTHLVSFIMYYVIACI